MRDQARSSNSSSAMPMSAVVCSCAIPVVALRLAACASWTTCHIHVNCLHVHMAPGNIRAIHQVPYTRVCAILWIPFTLFLVSPHGASWVAKPRASRFPNCAHSHTYVLVHRKKSCSTIVQFTKSISTIQPYLTAYHTEISSMVRLDL